MTNSYRFGALQIDDHSLTLPLTAAAGDDRTIEIFARVVSREGGESLPYLVYLQGGPGHEAPRPSLIPLEPSWLEVALQHYRVVLLDQRGTGQSTPVTDELLSRLDAEQAAEFLTHLRADGIVRDAEAIREHLGARQWSLLGQSFGGFTTLHYLGRHPDSVAEAYITGGLSAVGRHCDDVYARCYDQMRTLSQAYYRQFPDDRDRMRRLVDLAGAGELELSTGEIVSVSRLRSVGLQLGSDHGWRNLHWLLESDPRSNALRQDLSAALPYKARNPLYYVLHESSYADGCVTDWSAERTEPSDFVDDPTLFTGEHVRRDWTRTVPEFRPWAEVTDILAAQQWPKLYDTEALRASGAAGAAAVYLNDAFVPFDLSMETAALLPGLKTWVTSEYEHSGLRTSSGRVLAHLIDLAQQRRVR